MSEEKKESQGLDLGVDGVERESEFSRLEAEASVGPVQIQQQTTGPVEPETSEIIQPILEMGFAIVAPGWGVTSGECKQLSDAYGQLFDKYFPSGLGDYGVEISAVMLTAAIVLPRMNQPRKIEPEQGGGGSGNE